MDAYLFILLLEIVFIGIPVSIGLLIFFGLKRLGFPKMGKYLTIIFALFIIVIVLAQVFEDQLFTKNAAKELVEEQGFLLNGKLDLVENKSMTAIGDYYHTFTLQISEDDKLKAAEQIKNVTDFKKLGEPIVDFLHGNIDQYRGSKQVQNYETESSYVREYFKPNGQGYAPTFRRISVDKRENKLTFEDIDE